MRLEDVTTELESLMGRPSAWQGTMIATVESPAIGQAKASLGPEPSLVDRVRAAPQFRELGAHGGMHLASLEVAPAVISLEPDTKETRLEPVFGEVVPWGEAWLANLERAPCVTRVIRASVERLLVGVPRAGDRAASFWWIEDGAFAIGAGWEVPAFLCPASWPKVGSLDYVLALGRIGRLWTVSKSERPRILAGERGVSYEAKQRAQSLSSSCWRAVFEAARVRWSALQPDSMDGRAHVVALDDLASLRWAAQQAGVVLDPELQRSMEAYEQAARTLLPTLSSPELRDDPLVRAVSWQEPDQWWGGLVET